MDFNKEDLQLLKDSLQELYISQLLERKQIEGCIETIPYMIWSNIEQEDKEKKQKDLEEYTAKLNIINKKLLKTEELKSKIENALYNA